MIDPRTTDIVGTHVRLVKRIDPSNIQGRGVVRVVDYNQGAFALMIEAIGTIGDGSWFSASHGELFQVSLFDEAIAIVVENESKGVRPVDMLALETIAGYLGEGSLIPGHPVTDPMRHASAAVRAAINAYSAARDLDQTAMDVIGSLVNDEKLLRLVPESLVPRERVVELLRRVAGLPTVAPESQGIVSAPHDTIIAALHEALDKWKGFAEGLRSPKFQPPTDQKLSRDLERISQLRLLLDAKQES